MEAEEPPPELKIPREDIQIHRDLMEAARAVFDDETVERIMETLHLQEMNNRMLNTIRRLLPGLRKITRMIRTYRKKKERMEERYGREIDFSEKIEALKDVIRHTYGTLFITTRPDLSDRRFKSKDRGDIYEVAGEEEVTKHE